MLEAQQRIIDKAPERAGIDINADAGPIQARRIVERILQAERRDRAP